MNDNSGLSIQHSAHHISKTIPCLLPMRISPKLKLLTESMTATENKMEKLNEPNELKKGVRAASKVQ